MLGGYAPYGHQKHGTANLKEKPNGYSTQHFRGRIGLCCAFQ